MKTRHFLTAALLIASFPAFGQQGGLYRESPYAALPEDTSYKIYIERIGSVSGIKTIWNSKIDIPIENRHHLNESTDMPNVFSYEDAILRVFRAAIDVQVGFYACMNHELNSVTIVDHTFPAPPNCGRLITAINPQPSVGQTPAQQPTQIEANAPLTLPPLPGDIPIKLPTVPASDSKTEKPKKK